MSNKIDRRSFLKVLGIAGAACTMTALTGCDGVSGGGTPNHDGSVPLSDLNPLNGRIAWNNVAPEDPFGNVYVRGVNYSIFRAGSWSKETNTATVLSAKVEYLTDKKYKKLTMNLNPYKDIGGNPYTSTENEWGLVKVYADGKLVATSDMVQRKTKDTIKFEADITGADYIIIEPTISYWHYGLNKGGGEMILWDVKLWK